MRFSEVAYSLLTGQWRVDRARARELSEQIGRQRYYAGANPGMNRPTPKALAPMESYKNASERIVLIRAARQLEEDFSFIDALFADFETYVVGNLRYAADTGNAEANRAINDYLEIEFDECDYSERLDLTEMAKVAIRTMKRDGECGHSLITTGGYLRLESISGDRIGNPIMPAGTTPYEYGGIYVDQKSGAPRWYDIYNCGPKINTYTFQKRVPARSFLHYFNPFRFEQYHGVSALKNAIKEAFDLEQTLDFTKLNIKWRASQLPYVKNAEGRPRGVGYFQEERPASNGVPSPMTIDVDGVTQTFMKVDESVVDYPNDFPNQQFQPLVTEFRRDVALALKIPLEFAYRSDAGGVVQRFYVNKAENTFDADKRWLRRQLLNPYKNRAVQQGIDSGRLNLRRFGKLENDPLRFRGKWQMGKQVSVDYGKEVAADIKLIDAGAISMQEYAEENGKDAMLVLRENETYITEIFQAANRIAEQTGQKFELILPYLMTKSANPGSVVQAANTSDQAVNADVSNE